MENFQRNKRRRLDEDHAYSTTRNDRPWNRQQRRSLKGWTRSDQAQINQFQEQERHREFVEQEDNFLVQQKRKAAQIRVKEGRAQAIDWLVVNLQYIAPIDDKLNDDFAVHQVEYIDPVEIIKDQDEPYLTQKLEQIRTGILEFMKIDTNRKCKEYWQLVSVVLTERQNNCQLGREAATTEIERLLAPKSLAELEKLEKQITRKLESDEPMDANYWSKLRDRLRFYKADAKLKAIHDIILEQKPSLPNSDINFVDGQGYRPPSIRSRNKRDFVGYASSVTVKPSTGVMVSDKKTADILEEDEEVFTNEAELGIASSSATTAKNLRKPHYFNRVQLGYDWNKYNQTHYDAENPPPKVVQGYKFHIFYPDLYDSTKGPTYKIVRDDGRKKGETIAPAGEEDTCVIQFVASAPYHDIAFRIVDRDWDYSTRHERGFKSTFEDGVLTLHFSFKKVYYRK